MKNRLLALQLEVMTQSPIVGAMKKGQTARTSLNKFPLNNNYEKYLPVIGVVMRNGQPLSGIEVNLTGITMDTGQPVDSQIHRGKSYTNALGQFQLGLEYQEVHFPEVSQSSVQVQINGITYNIMARPDSAVRGMLKALFPTKPLEAILRLLGVPNPVAIRSTQFVDFIAIDEINIP